MDEDKRKELADIALAAAKEGSRQTLNEIFALLGVNLSNFQDVQNFRDDIHFVRRLRSNTDKVGARVAFTVVSTLSGATAIAAWEYLKALVHH